MSQFSSFLGHLSLTSHLTARHYGTSSFILVVVISGLAFISVAGLGWWLVRRRRLSQHPASRRGRDSGRPDRSGLLGSQKGWRQMPEDEDQGEMYGADAFEMDRELGACELSNLLVYRMLFGSRLLI